MAIPCLNLLTATIKDLQACLAKGEVTSVQLVADYLERIQRDNLQGLELRAVMETAPVEKLMEIARGFDEMRVKGNILGDLHGIPILVKDSIATDPELGMATSAGSYALLNSIPRQDATVIAKLRAASAIILGKTTMTQMGGMKCSTMPLGFSARAGQGSSAYVLGGHANGGDPLGSSSGSAVAVSAGWAAASLGTDTVGSLIAPAGKAALYTIRPTMGLVSRAGTVPGCKMMDIVGPMAKCVYDVALLLENMVGPDPEDPSTADSLSYGSTDYTRFTTAPHATFKGMRLGIQRGFVWDPDMPWGNDPIKDFKIQSELDAAIKKMQDLGAIICDPANIQSAEEWKASMMMNEVTIVAHEFKGDLADYLGTMKETEVTNLKDIIDYNFKHADLELPDGENSQDLLLTGKDAQIYLDAIKNFRRLCGEEGIDKVFSEFKLDALILPINALASSYAAGGGYPLAALPLGVQENGEPFGFCMLGRRWAEPTLLGLMAAFEANFPARAVPLQLLDVGEGQV